MALPLMALGAAIPTITSLFQLGKGLSMNPGANPYMGMPAGIEKNLSVAKTMASQTQIPGYAGIKSNLEESTANSIDQMAKFADSPTSILHGIQRLTGNQNEGLQQLGIAGAQNYNTNQRTLMDAYNNYGNWENEQWKQNVYNNWAMSMARKQALVGAGLQGLGGVGNQLYGGAMYDKRTKALLKQEADMFEQPTGTASTSSPIFGNPTIDWATNFKGYTG